MTGKDSFASVMNTFGQLTDIESRIEMGIERSCIPAQETRKFLRGMDRAELSSSPLLQYLETLLHEIGIGTMELRDMSAFRYTFASSDSRIYKLFPNVEGRAVCTPTVEALARFFTEDMALNCNVSETSCKNMGDPECVFVVELEPLSVYQSVLDPVDIRLLSSAENGTIDPQEAGKDTGMDVESLEFKLNILKHYQIINDALALTDAGMAYAHFISSHPLSEVADDTKPPWSSMERISSAIAATRSFAEALVEITEDEQLPWEADDAVLLDARKKASSKRSFAEMMNEFSSNMDDE